MSENQTPTNPAAELVAVVEDLVERQRQILDAIVTGRPPSRDSVQAVLLGLRGVVTKLRNGAGDDAATPDDAVQSAVVADLRERAERYRDRCVGKPSDGAHAFAAQVLDHLAMGYEIALPEPTAPSSVQGDTTPATPDDTALTVAMSAARKVSTLQRARIVMAMLDALAKAGLLAPTAVISDLRATAADLLTADDVTDHDRVAAQTLTDYADRLGKAAPSPVQGDTTPKAACVHGQTADLTGLAAGEDQS